jgi:hypothetical protein
MNVTLDMPRRAALRWLGGWYATAVLGRPPLQGEDFDTRRGIEALAALVPAAARRFAVPTTPVGRIAGVPTVGGLCFPVPRAAREPLRALAGVMGLNTPQEAIRAVADQILAAAPHVELDTSTEANFGGIALVVHRLRELCVRGAA